MKKYWKYWFRGWIVLLLVVVLSFSLSTLYGLLMEPLQSVVYYAPVVVAVIVWVTVGAAWSGWLFEVIASHTKRINDTK
jgi:uncharacterized membrane protein